MLAAGAGPCRGRGLHPSAGAADLGGTRGWDVALEKCHLVRVADGTEHQVLLSSLTVTAFPIPGPLTANVGSDG